ncbi:DUF2726 domain-containing protein [Vibrio sp. EJY3]|uniref:DUF2726 domain-containing protein n=1 Tax=Vibrio sp. (strain EJY3) TaxID=1116375 RepID=UPI000243B5F7|nr:DUF2726 domain-containing protein [Vibrio sp. EJY3]AEX21997.1 hypothetical protein VEJY3_07535 [Vibrio sp. EJY3]
MFEIVIVIILFLVLIVLSSKKASKKQRKEQVKPFIGSSGSAMDAPQTKCMRVPHKKHVYLSSKTERNFYNVLQEILPSDCVVHCQVSLMTLVQPVNFKDNSRTWAKRMDYVITDRNTKVLAVIELDDSSHRQKRRQERDHYVNSALEGHHKLIRFDAIGKYNPIDVAKVIERETDIKCNSLMGLVQTS